MCRDIFPGFLPFWHIICVTKGANSSSVTVLRKYGALEIWFWALSKNYLAAIQELPEESGASMSGGMQNDQSTNRQSAPQSVSDRPTIDYFPATSSAEMAILADRELSDVVACGFSSFTLVDGVARADLGIKVSTCTEIDSLKLGHYHDGTATGWDEDWTNVQIGSDTEDLIASGLYIEAVFENIDDPAARSLKEVKFGTADMTGSITAAFNSFSDDIAGGGCAKGLPGSIGLAIEDLKK